MAECKHQITMEHEHTTDQVSLLDGALAVLLTATELNQCFSVGLMFSFLPSRKLELRKT